VYSVVEALDTGWMLNCGVSKLRIAWADGTLPRTVERPVRETIWIAHELGVVSHDVVHQRAPVSSSA